MKVRGLVTGIIRDAETNEIKRTFHEENHVSEIQIVEFLTGTSQDGFGPNIIITDLPYETNSRVDDIIGSVGNIQHGAVEVGVTSPEEQPGGTGGTPFIIQFQQRFSAPAVDRTIRYIGLCKNTVASITNVASPMQAGVRLTTDCIQASTETLDVFYRVLFPYENDYLDPPLENGTGWNSVQVAQLKNFTTSEAQEWITEYHHSCYNGNIDPRKLVYSYHNDAGAPDHEDGTTDNIAFSASYSSTSSVQILQTVATIGSRIGLIVGLNAYGGVSVCYFHAAATNPTDSPIQNLFGHGSAADKPFYDSNNLPSGDGTLAFGGGTSWENPAFPKIYRVEITKTGSIGTSEYQIWERNYFGSINNTPQESPRLVHSSLNTSSAMVQGFNTTRDDTTFDSNGPRFVRYGLSEIRTIAIRADDALLWNLQTEDGVRFHSSTFPAFTASQITDVAVQTDGTIYFACATTGLYKVSDPTGTPVVTKIDDTTTGLTGAAGPAVYGVAAGRNDRLWIIMDGGLFYSDNDGTSWTSATFSFTGISNANWSNVRQISADIEHANDRLGIVYDPSSLTICWYEFSTTTASAGPLVVGSYYTSDNLHGSFWWDRDLFHTFINILAVSRTQSRWANACYRTSAGNTYGVPVYFTFGTTDQDFGTGSFYNFAINEFETDDDGNQSLIMVNGGSSQSYDAGFFKETGLVVEQSPYTSGSLAWTNSANSLSATMVYLGRWTFLGMISYSYMYIATFAPYNQAHTGFVGEDVLWKKYGWEGSPGAWVEGSSGSKITHDTEDDVIDGLTIQFDDDSGAQTFGLGDFHTVGVVKGILLDGATAYTNKNFIYMRPAYEDTALEITTIPGTTRYQSAPRYISSFTWQDSSGYPMYHSVDDRVYINSASIAPGFTGGVRTNESVGGPISTAPGGNVFYERRHHASVWFRLYGSGGTPWDDGRMVAGLSPDTVAGDAISYGSTHFGFLVDGTADADSELFEISVVEQGVTKYTYPVLFDKDSLDIVNYYTGFRVGINEDGSVEYELAGAVIYTSPPGTATATNNFIFDCAMDGSTGTGIQDLEMYGAASTLGHVFEFGTPGSPGEGRYRPDFSAICNANPPQFLIDGSPATLVSWDYDSDPATGEVMIFQRSGEFKVAPGDVGKAISCKYITVTRE